MPYKLHLPRNSRWWGGGGIFLSHSHIPHRVMNVFHVDSFFEELMLFHFFISNKFGIVRKVLVEQW